MRSTKMNLLKLGGVLLIAILVEFSAVPAADAAKAGGGGCGACAWQDVPCGGGQANMDAGCQSACNGGTASGCTRNDPDCAPIFADGWSCG